MIWFMTSKRHLLNKLLAMPWAMNVEEDEWAMDVEEAGFQFAQNQGRCSDQSC